MFNGIQNDLREKLNKLLLKAIQMDKASMGNIQLLNSKQNTLSIVVQYGFSEDFLKHFETVKAFDSSACGRAIGIGSAILICDVLEDIGFKPHRKIAKAADFRAVKSVPLKTPDNKFVGVLSTHFRQPKLSLDSPMANNVFNEIAALLQPLTEKRFISSNNALPFQFTE
jgi:hypothetical protein